jgi:hypothetical protein
MGLPGINRGQQTAVMTRPGTEPAQWTTVDEGWGRAAVDFAQLLTEHGFTAVERVDVPFAWEFADPELYARALIASGPAYEAIQNVGEAAFRQAAVEQARAQLRDGLPIRAELNVVGYLARKPEGAQHA